MAYTVYRQSTNKFRLLISGLSQTGKTTSLPTFIYGDYDCFSEDEEEVAKAIDYANNTNRKMIVITCPGELGVRSLVNTDHITSYYYEAEEGDISSYKWSIEAIKQFTTILNQSIKERPYFLVCDGLHSLWEQLMNRITEGEYLVGKDLNIDPEKGTVNPYRSARFHNQAHNAFGQYVAGLYNSPIPFIICTTWEDWQAGASEQDAGKQQRIDAPRYLWPAIPGKMAQGVVGRFDARISARLERVCLHKDCEYSREAELHYVWQFLPKDDVRGVGIKGLRRISPAMKKKPFIHQNYNVLNKLIEVTTT